VVTVLTDLNVEWHFFWSEEGAVHQIRADFRVAIQWLNLIVGADESCVVLSTLTQTATVPATFVRIKPTAKGFQCSTHELLLQPAAGGASEQLKEIVKQTWQSQNF
jgi:hypothetical protein